MLNVLVCAKLHEASDLFMCRLQEQRAIFAIVVRKNLACEWDNISSYIKYKDFRKHSFFNNK